MYEFKALENVMLNELCDCFNVAFSDYQIPMNLSELELENVLDANRADMRLSYGAFYNDELVGFLINSTGVYKGERVVFDVATAIKPMHRGRGVFSALYKHAVEGLETEGIVKYYLEVLQENSKAIDIYSKKGFEVVREYVVLKYVESEKVGSEERKIKECSLKEFRKWNVEHLRIPEPSYEHCAYILEKTDIPYKVLYEENKEKITAYIIATESGKVMEMGCDNLEALEEIIKNMQGNYKMIYIKNVDAIYDNVVEMLEKNGFKEIAKQYEMSVDISSEKYKG